VYSEPWQAGAGGAGAFALSGGAAKTGSAGAGHRPIGLASGAVTLAAGLLGVSASIPGNAPPLLVSRYGRPAAGAASEVAQHPGRSYSWSLSGRRLVAYVVPLRTGDAAILCQAPPSDLAGLRSCGELAQRAVVPAADVLSPGADASLAASITPSLRQVGAIRDRLGPLGGPTLADRAPRASELSTAESRAASSLARLAAPPRYRPAIATLASSLRGEASALGSLAASARSNDREAYSRDVSRVLDASRSLQSATRSLAGVGLGDHTLGALHLDGPPALPAVSAPTQTTSQQPTTPTTTPSPTSVPTTPAPATTTSQPTPPGPQTNTYTTGFS
jgi:hypothetical protein